MYYNHSLRASLQEWKNRLYRASYHEFGNQLKYLAGNMDSQTMIKGILSDACLMHPFSDNSIESLIERQEMNDNISYSSEIEHASYCYQALKYLGSKYGYDKIQNLLIFTGNGFDETKEKIIEGLISPVIYFVHDRIEKSTSIIYLLEKYKRRTEWFTRGILLKKYNESDKNYEQIFEDDLRLFLFDQGIDYPFSTPKSPSGRADLIGSIDSSDPLIAEIKIVDKSKNYSLNRVKEGFNQIVKYTNDYNKNFGYLVIFNIDKAEIDFKFKDSKKNFPPMVIFGDKTYFFVVINLYSGESASRQGQAESLEVSEDNLIA